MKLGHKNRPRLLWTVCGLEQKLTNAFCVFIIAERRKYNGKMDSIATILNQKNKTSITKHLDFIVTHQNLLITHYSKES